MRALRRLSVPGLIPAGSWAGRRRAPAAPRQVNLLHLPGAWAIGGAQWVARRILPADFPHIASAQPWLPGTLLPAAGRRPGPGLAPHTGARGCPAPDPVPPAARALAAPGSPSPRARRPRSGPARPPPVLREPEGQGPGLGLRAGPGRGRQPTSGAAGPRCGVAGQGMRPPGRLSRRGPGLRLGGKPLPLSVCRLTGNGDFFLVQFCKESSAESRVLNY